MTQQSQADLGAAGRHEPAPARAGGGGAHRAGWRGRGKRVAKLGSVVGLALTFSLVAAACGSTSSTSSSTTTTSGTSGTSATTTTAPQQFTVKMPVISKTVTDVFLALYVADAEGISKKNGITFTYQTVNSGSELLTDVVSGAVPFSLVPINTAAEAIQAGDAIQVIAYSEPVGDGFMLMSKAGSGITSVTDLKGKTICVSHPGSETYTYANWINKEKNLGLKVVPVGASAQEPSLLSGTSAACVETAPQSYDLLAKKQAVMLYNFGKTQPVTSVFIAKTGYATSNKAETEAVLKTWFEAMAKMKATKTLGIKYLKTIYKYTTTVAKAEYTALVGIAPITAAVTKTQVTRNFALAKATPTVKTLPAATVITTTMFKTVVATAVKPYLG